MDKLREAAIFYAWGHDNPGPHPPHRSYCAAGLDRDADCDCGAVALVAALAPTPREIQTRAVLAGAYRARIAVTLTHAAELDAAGDPVRVLCGRVDPESLADPLAGDPSAPPTCATCRRRDPRAR